MIHPSDAPLAHVAMPHGLSRMDMGDFPVALTIADAVDAGQPLVYVNRAFLDLTGYEEGEVIGKNCRFLQGEHPRQDAVGTLGRAIASGRPGRAEVVNYRKDGTAFTNQIVVMPLTGEDGRPLYYLGFQAERTADQAAAEESVRLAERLSELQHRVKNHLSLIMAMIRLEADGADDVPGFARVLAERIKTIGLLYDEFASGADAAGGTVSLGAYLSRVASAIHGLDGRPHVRLNTDIGRLTVDTDVAASLGLFLSEVVTNALRHAFTDDQQGEIRVALREDAREGWTLSVADDGQGLGAADWPSGGGLGGRIAANLAAKVGGTLTVVPTGPVGERPGTCVTLRFDPGAVV